jgi:hypothetical protein
MRTLAVLFAVMIVGGLIIWTFASANASEAPNPTPSVTQTQNVGGAGGGGIKRIY